MIVQSDRERRLPSEQETSRMDADVMAVLMMAMFIVLALAMAYLEHETRRSK